MKLEQPIEENNKYFSEFSNSIGLEEWRNKFGVLYQKWLDETSQEIHDLTGPLLKPMLNAIARFNQSHQEIKFYYWHDVDRDLDPDFVGKDVQYLAQL